jgi:hypothetical protein
MAVLFATSCSNVHLLAQSLHAALISAEALVRSQLVLLLA